MWVIFVFCFMDKVANGLFLTGIESITGRDPRVTVFPAMLTMIGLSYGHLPYCGKNSFQSFV